MPRSSSGVEVLSVAMSATIRPSAPPGAGNSNKLAKRGTCWPAADFGSCQKSLPRVNVCLKGRLSQRTTMTIGGRSLTPQDFGRGLHECDVQMCQPCDFLAGLPVLAEREFSTNMAVPSRDNTRRSAEVERSRCRNYFVEYMLGARAAARESTCNLTRALCQRPTS